MKKNTDMQIITKKSKSRLLYLQHPTSVKNRLFSTLLYKNCCGSSIKTNKLDFLYSPCISFLPKSWHNPNKCHTFAPLEPQSLSTILNRRQTKSNVKLVWTLPRCEGGRDLLKLKSGVVFYTTMRLLFDKSFMQL